MVCATEPPRIIILWFLATLIQLTSTSGKKFCLGGKNKTTDLGLLLSFKTVHLAMHG